MDIWNYSVASLPKKGSQRISTNYTVRQGNINKYRVTTYLKMNINKRSFTIYNAYKQPENHHSKNLVNTNSIEYYQT